MLIKLGFGLESDKKNYDAEWSECLAKVTRNSAFQVTFTYIHKHQKLTKNPTHTYCTYIQYTQFTHAYIHTYIQLTFISYIHTYIHFFIHTQIYIYIHTYITTVNLTIYQCYAGSSSRVSMQEYSGRRFQRSLRPLYYG